MRPIMVADPPKTEPKGFTEPTVNGGPALGPREDQVATSGGCCRSWNQVRRCLRANLLVVLTLVAVAIGVALGLGVSRAGELSPQHWTVFDFPGELLLRLLKMIILPLVVCSLISGAASLDPSALGRLGAWALLFFLVTTLLASALGVGLALALQPGASVNASVEGAVEEPPSKDVLDSFLDLARSDSARGRVGKAPVLGRVEVATWAGEGFGPSRALGKWGGWWRQLWSLAKVGTDYRAEGPLN